MVFKYLNFYSFQNRRSDRQVLMPSLVIHSGEIYCKHKNLYRNYLNKTFHIIVDNLSLP